MCKFTPRSTECFRMLLRNVTGWQRAGARLWKAFKVIKLFSIRVKNSCYWRGVCSQFKWVERPYPEKPSICCSGGPVLHMQITKYQNDCTLFPFLLSSCTWDSAKMHSPRLGRMRSQCNLVAVPAVSGVVPRRGSFAFIGSRGCMELATNLNVAKRFAVFENHNNDPLLFQRYWERNLFLRWHMLVIPGIRRNKMNAWVRGAVLMLYSKCYAKFFQGFVFFIIIVKKGGGRG